MGEPERGEDGLRDETSPSDDKAASEAKKNNDSTVALSEQDLAAMRVPAAAPPAVPTPRPAPAPKVSRHDASMWGGTVLVADEFEPLVVPKKPLGRWFLLAFFTLGLAAAALYFLWWQPAHDVATSEEPTDTSPIAAAAPAETQPAAAPAPPAAETLPAAPSAAAETAPGAAEPTAVAAVVPDKPTTSPPVKKKTSSKKKSSKKKSAKKSSKGKKKTSKKKTSRGG
ncbi:MAG TPA: hypothetical protein VIG06_11870 [Kofleriaceae bacterium]|jgi:hypothetical protein